MPGRKASAPVRFAEKFRQEGDCWIWTAETGGHGYGHFWSGTRKCYAHRWSYEHHIGPIPDGLVLDHLCRRPACANPWHLEPVPQRINLARGDTVNARWAARSHCDKGHPFDEANTGFYRGARYCRICINAKNREAKRRRRAERCR